MLGAMDEGGGEGGEAFDTHWIRQTCGRRWSKGRWRKMTDLYPHSTAISTHVRITMRPARTVITLMTAHIIMGVHSSHICAAECQCPSQAGLGCHAVLQFSGGEDRKSTRLNSSHRTISYAVFCLKK